MRTRTLFLLALPLVLTSCGGDSDPYQLESGGNSASVASMASSPEVAPALPATEVANAAPDSPLDTQDAFRLLEQATFGPKLNDIEQTSGATPEAWIDAQMQKPVSYLLPVLQQSRNDRWNEYVNAWWRQAIQADDQLRQRVAFALSQILVISGKNGLAQHQDGIANYYDILLRNAFGNYRTLLEEVTLSPVMGEYLSMKGNRAPVPESNIRPDENYAREVLQLFSIGLEMLNPDGSPVLDENAIPVPTYDQETIEAFAHVFTGWHFANADDFRWSRHKDYVSPMTPWQEYHDSGEKTLLNGQVLPAGQSAEEDLRQALDNIFAHPNVGPFIVKQLIQRLVTSNPSPGYVQDVVAVFNSNAGGERGNLASTVKAILMHREARLGHTENNGSYGKLKEPLLRVTQLWRAFEPEQIHRDFSYAWVAQDLEQGPLNAPSVFNFFRPDFSQPGSIADSGMVSPEFEIHDESSVITLTNRLLGNALWHHNYKGGNNSVIEIDISREMALEENQEALLDHLDVLLLGGRMTPELRDVLRAHFGRRDHQGAGAASQRVVEAIFLIASSPEAALQL